MAARFRPHAPMLVVDDDALTRLLVATALARGLSTGLCVRGLRPGRPPARGLSSATSRLRST